MDFDQKNDNKKIGFDKVKNISVKGESKHEKLEQHVSDAHPIQHELLKEYWHLDIAWILGRLGLDETSSAIVAQPHKQSMPIWSAANSILSIDYVPLKRVGFLPVIPYPVTRYDAVYTALKKIFKEFFSTLDNLLYRLHVMKECTASPVRFN